jgi:hypothetical protein
MQLVQPYRKMSTPELRQKWIDYWNERDRIWDEYHEEYYKECAKISAEWRKNRRFNSKVKLPVYPRRWPPTPPFPDELMGLT